MHKINELISAEITERILEKLNEIEKSSNFSNLDVSSILNKIHVLTSKDYVTIQNDLWKDVSKLSVDFYIDFEYYKQFSFQSKFSCKEYHDALESLGFKEINGFWKSYCKPSKALVINYIVQSCIYRTIMMKMNEGDSAVASLYEVGTKRDTGECLEFCPFCDKYLNNVGGDCEACCATAEEIENIKNQSKLIQNQNNDSSVAASIEVVENDDSVNFTANSTVIVAEENPQKINRKIEGGNDRVIEKSFGITNAAIIDENSINLKGKLCGGVNVEEKMNSVVCMEARTKSKLSKNSKESRENTSNNIENSEKDVPNGDDKHKGESVGEVSGKHDGDRLDFNKWKCKRCEFVNDDGNENCIFCMEERADWSCKYCTVVNELSFEQCSFCGGFRENKSNNIENSEKDGTSEGWTCWFGKCLTRNGGNEQFCTACGIDKSASRERGAAVNMCKYGGIQQVWICYNCDHINHDLTRSLCCRCFEYKVDVKGGDEDDKMGITRDNGANKWECSKCKSVNAREVLSCTHCYSPRIKMWSCEHCTMHKKLTFLQYVKIGFDSLF